MSKQTQKSQKHALKPGQITTLTVLGIVMFITGFIGYPLLKQGQGNTSNQTPDTSNLANIPTQVLTTSTEKPLATIELPKELKEQGTIILSLSDEGVNHLFAYHPLLFPLSRITNTPWDDITPAMSPDGTRLIYSSRKNGYWNLYQTDLNDGSETQITDTFTYEGVPSWSPDNQWITYEAYVDNNMDIYIQNTTDASISPIRLTSHTSAEYSPSWSASGRIIAYVSNQDQSADIWIANLDSDDERFVNLTKSINSQEKHPVWSPNGNKLAWVSDINGINEIYIWDSNTPIANANRVGRGDWPAWSPDGNYLLSIVIDPNETYLTAYQLSDNRVVVPPVSLPGQVHGVDWKKIGANDGEQLVLAVDNQPDPSRFIKPVITIQPLFPVGRYSVVALKDVNAPYPYLHDALDEIFDAFRATIGEKAGWDLLLSLENAYIPLTSPPSPGIPEDWLYTGRAFALSTLPAQSGWMVIVREENNGIYYWRVYIKTRYQDGSQGQPMTDFIWDFDKRFTGDPIAYEEGGAISEPPSGYWVDVTDLASQYQLKRLPALRNWRTYYSASRFNQFVYSSGMSWLTAMREIYPEEALITPTFIPTYTNTPVIPTITPTRRSVNTPTSLPIKNTPTPIPSATIRPTLTAPPPTPVP